MPEEKSNDLEDLIDRQQATLDKMRSKILRMQQLINYLIEESYFGSSRGQHSDR